MIPTHEYSNGTSVRDCRKNNKEQWNCGGAKALIYEMKVSLAQGWDDSQNLLKEWHSLLVCPNAKTFKDLRTGGGSSVGAWKSSSLLILTLLCFSPWAEWV